MSMSTWEDHLRFGTRLRLSATPRLLLSELLMKQWFEPVVPFTIFIVMFIYFSIAIPGYATVNNIVSLMRSYAEFGFVVLAMAVTLISGGIDLSVASMFAFSNFLVLYLLYVYQLPTWLAVAATLVAGASIGGVNGFLVGYLKTRPFLTTLVSLIVVRSSVNVLNQVYASAFATNDVESASWDFLGGGSVLGVPINALALLGVLVIGHIFLSRSRYGWHLTAIGGSRRAARHAGIRVQRMLFVAYALSGLLCAAGGVFYAARQASSDATTAQGWELQALTAAVLGGVSIAGGKGTAWRALLGGLVIFGLTNGVVRLGAPSYMSSAIIGIILLIAVGIDVKWGKNRTKVAQKIYVNPGFMPLASAPAVERESRTPFAMNDRLLQAQAIGLNQVEGPEDVILDREDRLYCGTRDGNIIRFSGTNFQHREIFAHIGGRPLGMQFDRNENLIVAVAGMGLYGVKPNQEVFKLTDETNRTWYKITNDSRIRMADDLDIDPDGKIYFSDCTTRYEMTTNILDVIEGRPNGRVICYDPATKKTRTLINHLFLPNGICVSHDGTFLLIASTNFCQIYRFWLVGEKKGKFEIFMAEIPGFCDNINRSSDGNYWLALVGIRTPTYDLSARTPDFRLRMMKKIPVDEWLVPGLNKGCVVKFDGEGKVLESYWDPVGASHSVVTSMREHKGHLYLGGIENNRVGRIKLEGVDPTWTSFEAYWGSKQRYGS
jgi:ribose transport system permease protein